MKLQKFGIFVLLLLVTVPIKTNAQMSQDQPPPSSVELMQQLKQASQDEYHEILGKFYTNGHLMRKIIDHSGLQQELRRVAEDYIYRRMIRGSYFRGEQNIESFSIGREEITTYKRMQSISFFLSGRTGVRVWMKILPHAPYSGPEDDTVALRLKQHGELFAKEYLKETSFKPNQEKNKFLYLRISNTPKLMSCLYGSVRSHWDDMNPGLQKRIKDFANQALAWDERQLLLEGTKMFAIATLMDRGVSEEELRSRLKVPDRVKWHEGGTTSGDRFVDMIFNGARTFRKSYPRWPIEGESPTDPHKNQTGQGHDKQRGEGHQ